jgi:branched-chain amino acid transport system substrate-binding protein
VPDRQKLRRALEALSAFDAGGVIISFSPTEHAGSRYVDISILGSNGRMLR